MTPGRVVGVGKAPPPASYALSLPRTLYGDDINGNSNMMMTQSMDPAHLAARLDNNTTPMVLAQRESLQVQELMTTSLDPSMLAGYNPANIQVWDFHYSRVFALLVESCYSFLQAKGLPEAWSKDSSPPLTSRPNSLFHEPSSQDLKDLYLQDLSDGIQHPLSVYKI